MNGRSLLRRQEWKEPIAWKNAFFAGLETSFSLLCLLPFLLCLGCYVCLQPWRSLQYEIHWSTQRDQARKEKMALAMKKTTFHYGWCCLGGKENARGHFMIAFFTLGGISQRGGFAKKTFAASTDDNLTGTKATLSVCNNDVMRPCKKVLQTNAKRNWIYLKRQNIEEKSTGA